MSVIFNTADYNLYRIDREAKLFNFVTKDRYKVYGLKDEGNPPIWFTTGKKVSQSKFAPLIKWLDDIGITGVKIDQDKGKHNEKFVPRQVSIGLRRDVRVKVVLSACLLQTIIYYLEGKLTLRASYRIGGIPKITPNQ